MVQPKQQQQQTTDTKLSSPKGKAAMQSKSKWSREDEILAHIFGRNVKLIMRGKRKAYRRTKTFKGSQRQEAEEVAVIRGAASAAEMGALNEWRRRRHCLRWRRRRRSRIMLNLAVTQTLGKGSHTMAQ